jgi:hypothetical protein
MTYSVIIFWLSGDNVGLLRMCAYNDLKIVLCL